jgi:peptidoglycan/xylan/chitin deacetylase (PgdA/CDA1 family)
VSGAVRLRGLSGPPGSRLAARLGEGLEPVAPLRGVRGASQRVIAELSQPDGEPVAPPGAPLPDGAAWPEAMAIRLGVRGVEAEWDEPTAVADLRTLLARCRERGRSSVDMIRADPSLLTGMQVGSWFAATWRTRALRRLFGRGAWRLLTPLALKSPRWLATLGDLAFWAGVRERADGDLWRRLTAASYVVLVYHRFAGELKPGQERIDISEGRFARQLRVLRIAGFRPVSAEDLLAFHSGARPELPSRSLVITVDDGLADCLGPLRRQVRWEPQLFIPTGELGGGAHWIDGEPVASREEIRDLESAGVRIGSHGRHHRRLGPLDSRDREEELGGSLADLREFLAEPLPFLAFPNGDHDAALCAEAAEAGYHAAFTTEKGRNGAGDDLHCLKRVSVHGHDGVAAVLWKALTGEGLPGPWRHLRERRHPPQPLS